MQARMRAMHCYCYFVFNDDEDDNAGSTARSTLIFYILDLVRSVFDALRRGYHFFSFFFFTGRNI